MSLSPLPIILNFLPVAAGGGLQNALSFLKTLCEHEHASATYTAIVRRGSQLEAMCIQEGIQVTAVADSSVGRLRFEMSCRRRFARGQTCFTFFGPPLLASKDYLVNVIGCAYSNLFHPEIAFWSYLPWLERFKKEFIDVLRKRMISRADYWIFETPLLAQRAVAIRCFPKARVGVVRMAASTLVSPERIREDRVTAFEDRLPSCFRFLLLCAAHPNKRLHLLPAIIKRMRDEGCPRVCIITTMNTSARYTEFVLRQFREAGVGDAIVSIGPISPTDVPSLIDRCDALCCISLLESFSNNFVEAWRMRRPLVVTDDSWGRDACGEGALYVDPAHANSCAESLGRLVNDANLRKKLIDAGVDQLATYPSAQQKNALYLVEIAKAASLGPCPSAERKSIQWS